MVVTTSDMGARVSRERSGDQAIVTQTSGDGGDGERGLVTGHTWPDGLLSIPDIYNQHWLRLSQTEKLDSRVKHLFA